MLYCRRNTVAQRCLTISIWTVTKCRESWKKQRLKRVEYSPWPTALTAARCKQLWKCVTAEGMSSFTTWTQVICLARQPSAQKVSFMLFYPFIGDSSNMQLLKLCCGGFIVQVYFGSVSMTHLELKTMLKFFCLQNLMKEFLMSFSWNHQRELWVFNQFQYK